jgi:hypothetical protein
VKACRSMLLATTGLRVMMGHDFVVVIISSHFHLSEAFQHVLHRCFGVAILRCLLWDLFHN